MGGRIWVESELGCGSAFHFTARLGIARSETDEAPPLASHSLDGLRVLVVDDNATNRHILETDAESRGYEADVGCRG